jgi:excinuclease ABC subunit A
MNLEKVYRLLEKIQVHQAAEHNLKHVNLTIPRDKLVVFTGVSGSGKSSLAFDTIFAEGQRRYVESLSSYARQYIGQFEKPNVESIEGLSPAISIDQKSTSRSPRSTVGTVTEILDYLRLLYAKVGTPHCPQCGLEISPQSIQRLVERILSYPEGTRLQILAPVVRGRKGEYRATFEQLRKEGYARVNIDGQTHLLEELPEDYRLEKTRSHTVSVVIDRLVVKQSEDNNVVRVTQSVETALKKADGFLIIELVDEPDSEKRSALYSLNLACPTCDIGFEELAPRMFSFNSPYGACPTCEGLGIALEISEPLLVPNPEMTLEEGTIVPFKKVLGRYYNRYIKGISKQFHIRRRVAFNKLTEREKTLLLHGEALSENQQMLKTVMADLDLSQMDAEDELWEDFATSFEGVVPMLKRRYLYGSSAQKEYIATFMAETICPACAGSRLKPISLSVTLGDYSLYQLGELSLKEAYQFLLELPQQFNDFQRTIGREPLYEAQSRLKFLLDVGLDYLTLNRKAATLSGGEAQRIRLASQIGAGLSGVLYVLDEPSIGLHPHNNSQLIATLQHLRDLGNSLIVVEHDEETMRAADWIVDIGPGAGRFGGEVVASGPLSIVVKNKRSVTGQYLAGHRKLLPPETIRPGSGQTLQIEGATLHNLKNLTVNFPLGQLIGVTGLSGSGKSTLVFDLLYGILQYHFGKHRAKPEGYKTIKGLEHLDKFIHIDQSPIGRSPRSNPATYTGIFDPIRNLFANLEEAKMKGFKPGHFSFNVAQGRCPDCKGDGMIRVEMNFLPDVYTPCSTCHGRRYNQETLEVTLHGKTIADVLGMTVEEAADFFAAHAGIHKQLNVLKEVGLGYIHLGQPATTLSGGEAQRVKLATEFCKRSTGKTLYLMDEPTIGLHWLDLENLLHILHKLVDAGNTVIVIEHNLDLIKMADHIIDLGPEGGNHGGEIVTCGPPRQVAQHATSYTAQYLRIHLD